MKVCALAGGVGGAKLAAGLQAVLPAGDLSVVVNTADDFDLWGLHICPDLDTVMYTLAGIANPATGWGIVEETFETLNMLDRYGEDTWFKLGDRDLATHTLRTHRLRSEIRNGVTIALAGALGVESVVLPMSDDPVSTVLDTPKAAWSSRSTSCAAGRGTRCSGSSFAASRTRARRKKCSRPSPAPTLSSSALRTRS